MIESQKERKRRQRASYHAAFRKRASSSTTGKSKGIHPTPEQRGACRRNRSYKRPDYAAVMASIGRKQQKD